MSLVKVRSISAIFLEVPGCWTLSDMNQSYSDRNLSNIGKTLLNIAMDLFILAGLCLILA